MIRFRNIVAGSIALLTGLVVGAIPVSAGNAAYDQSVGQAAAAFEMQNSCKGIKPIGSGDYQSFVIAASDMLAEQGLRRQKMRKLLFYGNSDWIHQEMVTVLKARGVSSDNTGTLCSLANKVAGRNDTIGRFLVRK